MATESGDCRWSRVSAHLHAASAAMQATHDRNCDVDCKDYVELLYAPKVTDRVEGGFGCFDYALSKTKSSVESSMGVGHANAMHAMLNASELRIKCRNAVQEKRKKSGKVLKGDEFEAEVGLEFKMRSFTSWRLSLPREERWTVIKSLQNHLRQHGRERREKRQAVADAAIARKKQAVAKDVNRKLTAVAQYLNHDRIKLIESDQDFEALKREHGESFGNLADAIRDQIRVRIHV